MADEVATETETSRASDSQPPPLAALFLIKFDIKIGYTIAWKRAIDGITLDNVVEFKSLPSGLHNVKEDLVYFVYEQYAGLSAFVSGSGGQEERNARFVAVGLLLPLKDGRLGRAWMHADELKKLARIVVKDSAKTTLLEEYWIEHQIHDAVGSEAAAESPFTAAQRRARTLSTATMISSQDQSLPAYHPAFSILELLDTFGPLIYPLHREALLRRRLLMVTRPPVHLTCDFVYDLSILSSLPLSLAPILTLSSSSLSRLTPLFALGIHDIPLLEILSSPSPPRSSANGHPVTPTPSSYSQSPGSSGEGWIACTSDEILTVKSDLYDVLVELPSITGNRWPVLKRPGKDRKCKPKFTLLKATQRDLRRYKALRHALNPIRRLIHQGGDTEERFENQEDTNEHTHLLFKPPQLENDGGEDDGFANGDDDKLTEPATWSALAYSSFIWWASAGEKDESEIEEEELDQELLSDLGVLAAKVADTYRYRDEDDAEPEEEQGPNAGEDDGTLETAQSPGGERNKRKQQNNALLETAVIAYFHRLTKQLFEACSSILEEHAADNADDEDIEVDDEGQPLNLDYDGSEMRRVNITSADLRRMGLDVWSQGDREFLRSFVHLWWGREVQVHGMGVECCGVRIC